MVTSLHRAATTLAETGPASHADGMTWWVVALITLVAIAGLGVCITLMTLVERKRHPHPHSQPAEQAGAVSRG